MHIPNDDTENYPFCRLQLLVETSGYSTKWNNQSKSNKSPQSCQANEWGKSYCKTLGTSLINSLMPLPPWPICLTEFLKLKTAFVFDITGKEMLTFYCCKVKKKELWRVTWNPKKKYRAIKFTAGQIMILKTYLSVWPYLIRERE